MRCLLFLVLILIILLTTSKQESNFKEESKFKEEAVKRLVRQAARWSTASTQDENPMIAVLHANYGAGYLWALKDIVLESEIEQITNLDIKKFTDEIVSIQDKATRKAVKTCPSFAPSLTYLAKIAGEN